MVLYFNELKFSTSHRTPISKASILENIAGDSKSERNRSEDEVWFVEDAELKESYTLRISAFMPMGSPDSYRVFLASTNPALQEKITERARNYISSKGIKFSEERNKEFIRYESERIYADLDSSIKVAEGAD